MTNHTTHSLHSSITDVPGIRAGHAQDEAALTGCTVVLCTEGAVGGVDQRGGAPGTRETDLLRPLHLVERVHAVMLAGGSAFGLDAASGVMRYLEEQGVGFETGVARIPIVPAAILFDLGIGDPTVRPDFEMGYQACQNATSEAVAAGNVGAGTGATVGKILGMNYATKSGIGSASLEIGNGIVIGALVAVNAFGDVFDPQAGKVIAGVRSPQDGQFFSTLEVQRSMLAYQPVQSPYKIGSTVIGVVATNAALTKEGANQVARMAQDGLARVIRPAHTFFDGDTLFALSTGDIPADVSLVGAFAAEVVALAILNGVRQAQPAGGLPSASTLSG